jgi:hypothetical protein
VRAGPVANYCHSGPLARLVGSRMPNHVPGLYPAHRAHLAIWCGGLDHLLDHAPDAILVRGVFLAGGVGGAGDSGLVCSHNVRTVARWG